MGEGAMDCTCSWSLERNLYHSPPAAVLGKTLLGS